MLTYVGGRLVDIKKEKQVDTVFAQNLKHVQRIRGEQFLISNSPLPHRYGARFLSAINTVIPFFGQEIVGHTDRLYAIEKKTFEKVVYRDLVTKAIVELFSREGVPLTVKQQRAERLKELSASIRSKSITTIKAIPAATLKLTRVAAATAFYGSLFVGVNNLFGLNSGVWQDYFPSVPDILVSAMPFYSVQRLERGMSDRLLKYRAIGDVFLAHQKGATDTLRVDLTLIGPYRGWYLLFLLMLQGRGETNLKKLANLGLGPSLQDAPPHEVIKIPKVGEVQYETHVTFPIITKTAIMLDMFLQTIEWHQRVDRGGHEVIHVHLLFRKFVEPIGFKMFDNDDKKGWLNYGNTLYERMRKEVLLDTIWKAREMGNELFNIGMFGGRNMFEIDMEAVSTIPYATDVAKLTAGYTFDLNGLGEALSSMRF